MAAAVAGSALIGGVSSYAGGQAQAGAANNAAQLTNQQYQQTRQDLTPYRQAGYGALGQINALLGLGGVSASTVGSGPTSGGGMSPGMLAAQQAGGTRGGGGTDYGSALMTGFLGARKNNSPIQDISQALAAGRTITDAQWAQAGFGPGGGSPNGNADTGSGNAFNAGPPVDAATAQQNAFAKFQTDPGYQFALDQGSQALQRSAAARGILNSGATAKALTDYGQGMASQQYGNYFQRLQSLAGVGQSATNATGQFGAQSAQGQGNALMAGGAARASAYGDIATGVNRGTQNYLAYNMNQGGGSGYPFDSSVNITQPRYF